MPDTVPAVSAALLLVASCAAPRYSPEGEDSRFTVTQTAPDVFRVAFDASVWTPTERARDFALLRASEAVLEHEGAWFTWEDASPSPAPAGASASFDRTMYANANGALTFVDSRASQPRAEMLVRAFRSKPDGAFAYDAASVRATLRRKYGIE